MAELLRETRSVCPRCLKNIPARLLRQLDSGRVIMEKTCPDHGAFSVTVWRGQADFGA